MNQASFVDKNADTWRKFEQLLDELESKHPAWPADDFPALYRRLCQHLSIARHRGYSAAVIDRLNPLVERGHALLYRSRGGNWQAIAAYVRGGFARDVRREWRLLLVALCAVYGPAVAMFVWLRAEPDWAYHVLGIRIATAMQKMYASSHAMHAMRGADSNFMMFAFYIYHNIGIALRTFGSGAVAGIGAFASLFYNGVLLGAVGAHLTNVGLGHNFWPYVIGHSAFELNALALSGVAAFKLGFAPLWPGRKTRLQAFRDTARDCLGIVAGMTVMLVIAAFIEGFWSANTTSPDTKYAVGAVLWAIVISYFLFAGRGHGSR